MLPGSDRVPATSFGISSATRSSSPSLAVMRTVSTKAISFSSLHGVGQAPEAVDLDRDLVAVLEQHLRVAEHADAGGRAGGDQVARLECDRAAGVGDDLRHRED